VHEPNQFWRSLRFVSQKSNLDTIPVNRSFSSRPGDLRPRRVRIWVFQRGSGFRWQTDGGCDGQQHRRASPARFRQGGWQTFNESGRNLIEPQARLAALPRPVPRSLRVAMSTAARFPATRDVGVRRITTLFPHRRDHLATASIAVRSCFFKSLMRPPPLYEILLPRPALPSNNHT